MTLTSEFLALDWSIYFWILVFAPSCLSRLTAHLRLSMLRILMADHRGKSPLVHEI